MFPRTLERSDAKTPRLTDNGGVMLNRAIAIAALATIPGMAAAQQQSAAATQAVTAAIDRRNRDTSRRAARAAEAPKSDTLPLFDSDPPAS